MWPPGSIARWACAALATLFVAGPVTESHAASNQLVGFNEWPNPSTFAIQRNMNAPVRRINVGWNDVQGTDASTWDWSKYDPQYQAMIAAGIQPLIVAIGSPCWSHPSTPCSSDLPWQAPDSSYDSAWGEFMRRLAARYSGAAGIEIWNEPNLNSNFQPQADPERYTDLLKTAYTAVKAVDPAMPVISGGLAAAEHGGGWGLGDSEFLQRMYAAGAKGYMDGIGIHTYLYAGGTGPEDPPYYSPAVIEAPLDRLRAVRDAAGDQPTPLWITEAGESTATQDGYPPAASESQQATDLVALVRATKAMPDVHALIIDRLSDIPVSYGGPFALLDSGFGVLHADGSPKAAACALSAEFGGNLSCSSLLPTLPAFALGDSATLTEGSGATMIDVLANDLALPGSSKVIQAKTDGAHGTVAIAPDGSSLTYAPQPNYCGSDSFTYTLVGGSQATVLVNVTCVDQPPVAVADSATTNEGVPASIDVLANDTDVDGGPKTIAAVTNGAHGTVTVAPDGSSLTYAPDPGYCSGAGFDGFTYTLNGGSTAAVYVRVNCVDQSAVAVNPAPPSSSTPSATTVSSPARIVLAPPRKTSSRRARFAFASEGGTGFTCRLDGAVKGCGSSLVVTVSPGSHRLEVWVAGSPNATPATYGWRVKRSNRS